MNRIESTGVVIVVRATDFTLELEASAVGQLGESAARRQRHLRSRVRSQFDGEALAVGRDQGRIDHTAFEDRRHVIAHTETRRDTRRTSGDNCDAREDKRSQAGGEGKAARWRKVSDQGECAHGCRRQTCVPQRDWLLTGYRYASRDRSERQEKGLMEAHMTLVAMCAGNSQAIGTSGVLEGLRLNTNCDGTLQMIEILQYDEHLVSAVIGVPPTLTNRGIEKVCYETVRVTSHGKLVFEHAGPLEFSKTFQLVAGKPLEKIQDKMSIDGNCGPKKSTD